VLLTGAACGTSGGKKEITKADLAKAVPTADELGSGFRRNKADETDQNQGTKLNIPPQCKSLINSEPKSKKRVRRSFKDGMGRKLDFTVAATKKSLASVEKAAKGCKKVSFSDGSNRGIARIDLKPLHGIGDRADTVDIEISLTQPLSLTIKVHGVLATRGDIGMIVVGTDAVDSQGNVTTFDHSVVDKAGRKLDQRVKDLQS